MISNMLRKPARLVAAVAFGGLWTATAVNALWLQEGPHPAPLVQQLPWQGQGDAAQSQNAAQPAPQPDELVRDIQAALAERGFYRGPVDGLMGPATREAIDAYQRLAGEEPGQAPSPALLARIQLSDLAPPVPPAAPRDVADLIGSTTEPVPSETVKPEAAGNSEATAQDEIAAIESDPAVASIQRVLADLGYAPGPIDGRWGSATSGAISRFQADRGLPVTGEAGDQLIAELERVSGVELR